jgi:hypothetical protein
VLLARLLLRIGKARQALALLRRIMPVLLEQATASARGDACLLVARCELLLSSSPGPASAGRIKKAVKWLERAKQDWIVLDALPQLRSTTYLLVRDVRDGGSWVGRGGGRAVFVCSCRYPAVACEAEPSSMHAVARDATSAAVAVAGVFVSATRVCVLAGCAGVGVAGPCIRCPGSKVRLEAQRCSC